jgi:hypothetical protein
MKRTLLLFAVSSLTFGSYANIDKPEREDNQMITLKTQEDEKFKLFDNISVNGRLGANFAFGQLRSFEADRMFNSDRPAASYPRKFFGWGFGIEKQLSHLIGIGFNLNGGQASGTRTRSKGATINKNATNYFHTNFIDYSGYVSVNISSLLFGPNADRRVSLSATAGYGLVQFRSALFRLSDDKYIRGWGYKGQPAAGESLPETRDRTSEAIIPVSAIVSFKLSPKIDLGVQQTVVFTNTDKFDTRVSVGGSNDIYTQTQVAFTFKFGNSNGVENIKWNSRHWSRRWINSGSSL